MLSKTHLSSLDGLDCFPGHCVYLPLEVFSGALVSTAEVQQLLECVSRLEQEKMSLAEAVGQKDSVIEDLRSQLTADKGIGATSAAAGVDLEDLLALKDKQIRELESTLLDEKRAAATLAQEKSAAEEMLSAADAQVKQLKSRELEERAALEELLSQKDEAIRQLESRFLSERREVGEGWGDSKSSSRAVDEMDELRKQPEVTTMAFEPWCSELIAMGIYVLRFQKTLNLDSNITGCSINTYVSMDCSDHWCWGLDC